MGQGTWGTDGLLQVVCNMIHGTWDMGHGTWDMGHGTWDMDPLTQTLGYVFTGHWVSESRWCPEVIGFSL